MLTRSEKARLGQSPDILAFLTNGATYHSKWISRQGKAMVLGSKEVGSSCKEGSIANRRQSTPGYVVLKCKNKR